MKKTTCTILIIILFACHSVYAQIGLQVFETKEASFKSVLNEAKDNNTIALYIIYTDAIPVTNLPRISKPDTIKFNNNIITDVVDPYVQIRHPLINRVRPFSNPHWITVDPDNIVIGASRKIKTDKELSTFIRTSLKVSRDYHLAKTKLKEDKNDISAQKEIISATVQMHESSKSRKYINKYLKKLKNPTKEDLQFVLDIADECTCSSKLIDFIEDHQRQIEEFASPSKLLKIRQQFIIEDLKEKQLLEPYYVWKAYEKKLGAQADSLYRLFAIEYFSKTPGNTKELVNESIDFLNYYPESSWDLQDHLYKVILANVKEKEDLELMLDLISGQIFKSKNYRKLDYRAVILYRLGHKEQSLKMLQEIASLAAAEGIRYKSMIYQIQK